jgi:hypothetical protein
MASKTEETPQKKEEMPEQEGPETLPDDLSDAAIKKLMRSAKKRGYVLCFARSAIGDRSGSSELDCRRMQRWQWR